MDGQSTLMGISFLIYFGFCIFCIYQREIMLRLELRKVRKSLKEISKMVKEARTLIMSCFDDRLMKEEKEEGFDKILDYFIIAPIETDKSGVMNRLEYLLDTGDETLETLVKPLSPDGDLEKLENLKQMFREAIILNRTFKMVREIYLSSKKSKSLETMMQATMNLSLLVREAKIRFKAVKAYVDAQPIGESIGPLVAAELMDGSPFEVRDGVVVSEKKYKDWNLVIVKPKGPGARSRNLGKVVEAKILEEKKVAGVVIICAQVKLEGEKSVIVTPATGVAFVSEPEKFRLEELASQKKIPLISLIVKMSNEEYFTRMSDEIRDAVPRIIEKIEATIGELDKGKIIVVGSGNTMAISP
ncbi:MAG: DUF1512 family protein [Candidatus Jordarchaeum sp.]|uniref:DUF1512 family protein n=1 Tax=Candidatus Jordarchaeum sp. TaxID=2823881 RepID=UPI00404A81EE